ncbi:hypothetical protein, partial [uncultured Pseudomonas sp.]|uniref:hypothetical protein n=1 Tax=uncultured Pseudomonas sp. TaxID=114707 RepID=UPI0025F92C41
QAHLIGRLPLKLLFQQNRTIAAPLLTTISCKSKPAVRCLFTVFLPNASYCPTGEAPDIGSKRGI